MRLIVEPMGQGKRFEIAVLSRREAQVLRLLCQGLTNKGIGAELRISPLTVASYIAALCRLLRLENRVQLLLWGLQNPSALGPGAPPALHPRGCLCNSVYCSAMRMGLSQEQPAA